MHPQLQKPPPKDDPPCFAALPLALVLTLWAMLVRRPVRVPFTHWGNRWQ